MTWIADIVAKISFFIIYLGVCVHTHVSGVYRSQKRVSHPLKLELPSGCELSNVGAENQT